MLPGRPLPPMGPGGPGGVPDIGALLQAPEPPEGNGPDSSQVETLASKAASLLQQALGLEKDPEDRAELAALVADIHKFVGSQQKLVDKATGAGPGAKLVRKAAPSPGGGY